MADIIKTWPASMDARKVALIFSSTGQWNTYYFTLGRGKPKQQIEHVWYTWRGRILGYFDLASVTCNDGSFPQLRSLSGEVSEWQIRKDAWVAVCFSGCHRLRERVFFEGFRGWRYFDLDSYRGTVDAKHRL